MRELIERLEEASGGMDSEAAFHELEPDLLDALKKVGTRGKDWKKSSRGYNFEILLTNPGGVINISFTDNKGGKDLEKITVQFAYYDEKFKGPKSFKRDKSGVAKAMKFIEGEIKRRA